MDEKYHLTGRGRTGIALTLLLAYLGVCIFSAMVSKSTINKPFPGFLVLKNNLVNLIYLPEWEGIKKGIKPRDIIEEVNGKRVNNADQLYRIINGYEPGTPVTYTILRGKTRLYKSIPVSIFTLRDYLVCYLTWTLTGAFFFITSLIVFYLKPNSPASRVFVFSGILVGSVTASIFEHCTTHVNHIPLYLFPIIGPATLLLGVNFPEVSKLRKPSIIFILVTTIPLVFFYRYSFSDVFFYLKVDALFLIHMLLNTILGVSLMTYSFATSKDPLTRQKGKIVIYGFIIGTFAAISTIYGSIVLKKLSIFWVVIPVSMIPLSFGYAIVKHNLFDVDVFIRRSISYLLVSGVVLALFFGIIGIFSVMLQSISGQSSQIAAVIATILIIMLFRPLRIRTDRYLDRIFFREKYEYQKTIRKASGVLVSIIELDLLLNQMLRTIIDAIKIERGMILLKDEDSGKFLIKTIFTYTDSGRPERESSYKDTENYYFTEADFPIYKHLESSRKPIQLNDIEELDAFMGDREMMLRFMHDLDIVLAIPIIYERQLTGLLGLGLKKSGAWYSNEDIELLQTLMMQTAVSIENARKVDELKKMVELETSYRDLQKVNEMKDNFISMVSHDLRTPMTCIKGYASFMHQKPDKIDKETMKEYSGIIIDETDRLTRLISNILDIQRFEAGRVVLEFRDINIINIVEESLILFRPAAEQKNISLEKDLADQEIIIRGHADRLRQVLANLLSNAIKFTPEKGQVKLIAERISDNGNPAVKVSVSDTGIGIPESMQEMIFQKFHQAEKLVRDKEEGSGLGLALVREIIEYHGGQVGVTSNPGQGSAFYFIVGTVK